MRGSVHDWHGRKVIPTFHPAASRHGGAEPSPQFLKLREDFELIRRTLDELLAAPVVVPEAEPEQEQLELF
jgi:hypothetical protein